MGSHKSFRAERKLIKDSIVVFLFITIHRGERTDWDFVAGRSEQTGQY